MKKKAIIVLALILFCLSTGAYGSYAYFTVEKETTNVITAGNLRIELVETEPSQEAGHGTAAGSVQGSVVPGKRVSQVVQVENTGDYPAYVRVRVAKTIVLAEGTEGQPDPGLIICGVNREHWIEGEDGCYYYQDRLEAGELTEPLFQEVEFDASMGNMYQGSQVRLEIQAQATQVAHNGENVMEANGWPDDGMR